MDEESTRLRPDFPSPGVTAASGAIDRRRAAAGRDTEEDMGRPAAEISRLRTEIDATRDQLGTYVSELDRRRHEALDLKLQVRKHPALAIGAGVAIVGAVAGAVVMATRARRREAVGQELRRFASFPPAAPTGPPWMLKLILKAALPIGIAVVTRLLNHGTSRRPPGARRAA